MHAEPLGFLHMRTTKAQQAGAVITSPSVWQSDKAINIYVHPPAGGGRVCGGGSGRGILYC